MELAARCVDITEAVEDREQGSGSFSVLFSTATPGPETPPQIPTGQLLAQASGWHYQS